MVGERTVLAVCLMVALAIGCEKPGGKNADVRELIQSERDFAAAASERGVRSAFLSFLAEDGVVFRPGPVNGRDWYLAQRETGAFLGWEPAFAGVSLAGDLGFTTGPWSYAGGGDPDSADVFGQYVSIWKTKAEGKWRVVLDIGTVNPAPRGAPGPLETLRFGSGPARKAKGRESDPEVREVIEKLDAVFAGSCDQIGPGAAFGKFADEQIRLLRMDRYPVIGIEAVRRFFGSWPDSTSSAGEYVLEGSDVASSGDMGYVYGKTGKGEGGSFVRIWRRQEDGNWAVVLDILLPRGTQDS